MIYDSTVLRKVHNTGSVSLFKMSFFFKCLLIKVNSIRRSQCFLIVTISIIALDFRWDLSRPLAGYGLPPPPRGNFVDHIFLEAQCLARILQHVSPLTKAALSCNSLLHTLPYKTFDN